MIIKSEDNNKNAIVVVGYNRYTSLKRLLASLEKSFYSEDVPLVISIDCSGDEAVYELTRSFKWTHGNKYVNIQKKRLGLKEHIYRCGDLTKHFRSVTILEDDLYVSPYFYSYVKQTVDKYGNEDNVAGISLYRNERNGFNGLPLYFLNNGNDVFAYQSTSTWGEIFTSSMWSSFRTWLNAWDEDFSIVDTYDVIKKWDRAWSKYYEAYLILTKRYFIYPYLSLSTNNNDLGEHAISSQIDNTCQVELLWGDRIFVLGDFDNLLKYDTYAQSEFLRSFFTDKDILVDLNGNRENIDNCRYLLTIRHLNKRIIQRFGIKLRPIELNVVQSIHGDEIFLYDMSINERNTFKTSMYSSIANYYLRDFNYHALFIETIKGANLWELLKRCIKKLLFR